METSGVVTPKPAIATRNQITWYTRLQKPDRKKQTKKTFISGGRRSCRDHSITSLVAQASACD